MMEPDTEPVIPDCGWSELEERLLGPSCDRTAFQTAKSWLGMMREHFRREGFDYDKAVQLLKSSDTASDTKKIMEMLTEGHWIVLKTKNERRLATIQKVLPIVYSLTERRKSFVVTTDDLIGLFKQPWKRDVDAVVQHESVRMVEAIKSGGLLFWEKINAMIPGAAKFSGYFEAILREYSRRESPVVVTLSYWRNIPNDDTLLAEIERSVGGVVSYYFRSRAKFVGLGG